MKHNSQSQIICEVIFEKPYQFIYVYHDNTRHIFNNIINFKAVKTGCYLLTDEEGILYVVRPLHDYVIEKPQPKGI
jgi:hypothetical protein